MRHFNHIAANEIELVKLKCAAFLKNEKYIWQFMCYIRPYSFCLSILFPYSEDLTFRITLAYSNSPNSRTIIQIKFQGDKERSCDLAS